MWVPFSLSVYLIISQLIREGLRDRVTRLPPVSAALRDRADAPSWEPTVKFVLADDIPFIEREDFKRMRPHSQASVVVAPVPVPVVKTNRPPKPVNTFLMFCREWRKKIMVDHANASAKDASKILGEMWQKLTDQQRARYGALPDPLSLTLCDPCTHRVRLQKRWCRNVL